MRLTVLGGCGAWPTADQPCSGYLVEHEDFTLLVDPGYATMPALLRTHQPDDVDAVLVTHRHPDHCADLNPLLRSLALRDVPPPALPVYAPPGALDAVLALDRPGMLAGAYTLHDFPAGDVRRVGPYDVEAFDLPHSVPDNGYRIGVAGSVLAYTGDTGPSPAVVDLARDADVFLCEATHTDAVPAEEAGRLGSARDAGGYAARAGVGHLVLTHLWPGTDPADARRAAATAYDGPITVARPGLVLDVA
ncbi:MAG: MBL fold metallo-hydrolase [Streptosporangiales bacterium]|nr:MBL fold metallo-hydrolase [Streptosporangiales bacterium]